MSAIGVVPEKIVAASVPLSVAALTIVIARCFCSLLLVTWPHVLLIKALIPHFEPMRIDDVKFGCNECKLEL
jgi:hypothetical protein